MFDTDEQDSDTSVPEQPPATPEALHTAEDLENEQPIFTDYASI